MNDDAKIETIKTMLGEDSIDVDIEVLRAYLNLAKEKILNKRYPHDHTKTEIDERYDNLHCELTIALYNQQGAEGEKSHNENGVSRSYRTVAEILEEIPCMAGLPL